MRPPLILCAAMVLFSGCQQPTAYAPKTQSSESGFSEHRISDREFAVTFAGSPDTSMTQARDFALLRAAELTHQAGYAYFRITRDGSRTKNVLRKENFFDPPDPITSASNPFVISTAKTTTVTTRLQVPAVYLQIETLADRADAGKHFMPVFAADEVIARVASKYRLQLKSAGSLAGL